MTACASLATAPPVCAGYTGWKWKEHGADAAADAASDATMLRKRMGRGSKHHVADGDRRRHERANSASSTGRRRDKPVLELSCFHSSRGDGDFCVY